MIGELNPKARLKKVSCGGRELIGWVKVLEIKRVKWVRVGGRGSSGTSSARLKERYFKWEHFSAVGKWSCAFRWVRVEGNCSKSEGALQ